MFRNRGNELREWVGMMLLRTQDGDEHEFTYRSVLIENATERKRKRGDGHDGFGNHRFPDVFGLDYTRRFTYASGLPGVSRGNEVVITA